MSNLNLSALATISGGDLPAPVTETLFTDAVPLTGEAATVEGLIAKFFGTPTLSVDATETKTTQAIKVSLKLGLLNPTFDIPYQFPAGVQKFVSEVEAAGYTVDLVLDAAVA